MSEEFNLKEILGEEEWRHYLRETAIQDQAHRHADKQAVYAGQGRDYEQFCATITTFIAAGTTGSSLSFLLSGHCGAWAKWALLLCWLSVVTLLTEKLVSMRAAGSYGAKLADNSNEAPGKPWGNGIIFFLQVMMAVFFVAGLFCLGMSWL